MKLEFIKMEGCGNDYVYVDCVKERLPQTDKTALAIRLSDRHFGIGGDGLIFVNPSDIADFEMEMYNADGSRGEMCGNGIRCVAKLVYDRGYVSSEHFTIASMGAVKYITVLPEGGRAKEVTVDMGIPILETEKIPLKLAEENIKPVNVPITAGSVQAEFTGVSMGNPHSVIFMDSLKGYVGSLDDMPLESIGPSFESHSYFPARVNTEFVETVDRSNVKMRVWERGSGETLACGTGCCATCVAGVLTGRTDRELTVHVRGGDLKIHWNEADGHVYMTGPAREVFTGEFDL
ncbi:MAG: diaminopimelate epimerase [Lachnospiraceae bacterium]|nr:diaminopimelate epimerase [Lachnospiraceae bacterium]